MSITHRFFILIFGILPFNSQSKQVIIYKMLNIFYLLRILYALFVNKTLYIIR